MKKFASLVLAVLMLAAMMTVFALPASAKVCGEGMEERGFQESREDLSALEKEYEEIDKEVDVESGSGGSVLSNGSIWIIAAVAVVAVAGAAALIIVKKKKKPALAGGEKTDE